MIHNSDIVFLSGGTGTPKLLMGVRKILRDEVLTVIGNTGDDDTFFNLHVSPDIDTLLYLFSGYLDDERFWGIKNDSFHTLEFLAKLKEEVWFRLGDRDLAVHILRSKLLAQGLTLTEITKEISNRLNIHAKILPMSNDTLRTKMITREGKLLSFQEYTVKCRESIAISKVLYQGSNEAKASNEVLHALMNAQLIIIGPSNPITSIGPMLAIPDLHQALVKTNAMKIAISPLVSGKAFSGPAAQLMKELGLKSNTLGIAEFYKEIINALIISTDDKAFTKNIMELGIKVLCSNISLKTDLEREALAKLVLKEAH